MYPAGPQRGRREILRSRAGSYGISVFFSKPGEEEINLFNDVLRYVYPFDDPANLTAKFTDFIPVFHL